MSDEEEAGREPAATADPRGDQRGPAGGNGGPRRTGESGLEPDGDAIRPRARPDGTLPASAGSATADGAAGTDGAAARGGGPVAGGTSAADAVGPADEAPSAGGLPAGAGVRHDGADGARDEPPGTSGRGTREPRPQRRGSFWRELPVLIIVALGLTLLIKAFAVQAFYIPSSSMENTLKIGDRVLVNKIVYHTRPIHRGDVVVFNGLDSWDPSVPQTAPSNPVGRIADWIGAAFWVSAGEEDYIKRVIGVPGDHVKCCDLQGRVTVNGVPLSEGSYLYPGNAPSVTSFSITVPPGELWVMGDHRAVSYDSRQHLGDPGGGAIPENKIVGRAFVIVWPVSRIRILPIPSTFQQNGLSASGLLGRAAAAVAPAAPAVASVTGAVPLTLLQRRLRLRYRKRRA